jgi:endoglycosylceramidase
VGVRARGVAAVVLLVMLAGGGYWVWAQPSPLTAGGGSRAGAVPDGFLGVRGGRIVDGAGRTVELRGFDVSALAAYPNPYSAGVAPLNDEDARLMAAAGFDVARLAISWRLLEPRRHQLDRAYLERVAAAVHTLERHGLRVVLDMHMGIGWGAQAQAPDWASLPWVPDVRPVPVEPWTERVSPRPAAEEAHFWTSGDWQADYLMAWRAVAARFRGDPMLAGYDLFNEPHPVPMPPAVFEARYLWPFYARAIDAVSAVDPDHLFIVEGTLFFGFPTATAPLRAPNLVYAPHLYTGSLIPSSGDATAAVASELAQRRREADALPAALWVGELGTDHTAPGAAAWTGSALDALARAGVGWAWWQWRQDGGWGIRSVDGRHLNLEALRRMARPYLEAAPPDVRAEPTDDGLGLRIEIPAGHGAAPLRLRWPTLTMGPPYLTASCSTSPPPAAPAFTLSTPPDRPCTIRLHASPG